MLTEDQIKWLTDFFALCDTGHGKLSTWEQNFVRDQKERYEEHGNQMRLSPKQWNVLNKIDAKLNGEA